MSRKRLREGEQTGFHLRDEASEDSLEILPMIEGETVTPVEEVKEGVYVQEEKVLSLPITSTDSEGAMT